MVARECGEEGGIAWGVDLEGGGSGSVAAGDGKFRPPPGVGFGFVNAIAHGRRRRCQGRLGGRGSDTAGERDVDCLSRARGSGVEQQIVNGCETKEVSTLLCPYELRELNTDQAADQQTCAVIGVAAYRVFSRAGVGCGTTKGVTASEGNGTDGERFFVIRHCCPVRCASGGMPHSAVRCSEPNIVGIERINGDHCSTTADIHARVGVEGLAIRDGSGAKREPSGSLKLRLRLERGCSGRQKEKQQ